MLPFESFFFILLAAMAFTQLFNRMRIPWVVALIVGGMIAGPGILGWFETDATLNFLANIGLIFLMFMAGLESPLSSVKGLGRKISITSSLVGLVPALVGFGIILAFGYSLMTAILMAILFMSSAVALLIPQFQKHKILNSELGRIIVISAVVVDIVSLVLLSLYLQVTGPGLSFGTLVTYIAILVAVSAMYWAIPHLRWLALSGEYAEEHDLYEKELRFIILVMIGFVVFFELVGLHAIVAAFFAGLVLSGSIKSQLIKAKLHALSYGFFVPIFFVVVGATVDLKIFVESWNTFSLTLAVVLGLIISKYLSGYIAGKILGYDRTESSFIGVSMIPQLSTTLAVAFLGFGQGLLPAEILASVIAMVIITPIIAPIMSERLAPRLTAHHYTGYIEENSKPLDEGKL
ncbi:MAG TPA: cation:proton antiporter [Candidatus Paceibacterota bacterium]|nr:cation:proton antiporter [Candidatus Paceibacterota bacterium]HMO82944.1 cation:proton antiporter [Candidatus Paceibacterota bacterium]